LPELFSQSELLSHQSIGFSHDVVLPLLALYFRLIGFILRIQICFPLCFACGLIGVITWLTLLDAALTVVVDVPTAVADRFDGTFQASMAHHSTAGAGQTILPSVGSLVDRPSGIGRYMNILSVQTLVRRRTADLH
jgi:hypothetical protein